MNLESAIITLSDLFVLLYWKVVDLCVEIPRELSPVTWTKDSKFQPRIEEFRHIRQDSWRSPFPFLPMQLGDQLIG